MDVLTEVYKHSIAVLKARPFQQRLSNIEPKLRGLFAESGPNPADAGVLDHLRSSFEQIAKASPEGRAAIADEIVDISNPEKPGFQDRAALIKLLRHFYFLEVRGNQSIWVVDHPIKFNRWCYDEFNSQTEDKVKTLLESEHETFGDRQRRTMSTSLQLARKWSMDVQAKLGRMDDTTKGKVKRWFLASNASDDDIKKAAATLSDGFKKISGVCNSTTVIFSDRPAKRSGGGFDTTFASVNSGDVMPVIYIFRLFLREGKKARGEIGLLWLCALTLIHELSHKLAKTKDISYDDQGLKPGGVSLRVADAIRNADSWGYFAADMVGALEKSKLDEVYV